MVMKKSLMGNDQDSRGPQGRLDGAEIPSALQRGSLPGGSEDRLSQLRHSIASGLYRVPTADIAASMIGAMKRASPEPRGNEPAPSLEQEND